MPPVAFCKHPHLTKPARPARLGGKKYDPERSGGVEIFFQPTRRAPVLPDWTGCQKFACEKANGEKPGKQNENFNDRPQAVCPHVTSTGASAARQPRAGTKVSLPERSEAAERRRSGWSCWPKPIP